MTLLMFAGLFLIGLILLQRGRGGGLAGAFGGMGGQSAFGTKAGDVFTRITIGVAAAWILLCAGSVVALHNSTGQRVTGLPDRPKVKPGDDAKAKGDAQDESSRENAGDKDDDLKLDLDSETKSDAKPEIPSDKPAKADPANADEVKKTEPATKDLDPVSPPDAEKKTDNPAPDGEKN